MSEKHDGMVPLPSSGLRLWDAEFEPPRVKIPQKAQALFLDALRRVVPEIVDEILDLADCDATAVRIDHWANKRGLTAAWLQRYIRTTIATVREAPETRAYVLQSFVGACWREPQMPALPPPTWNPFLETKARFLGRVNAYVQAMEAAALQAGGKRVSPKRTRDGAADRHFEWLVRYQVRGETFARIARDLPTATRERPDSTVSKAVHQTATLLQITLRTE